MSDISTGSDTDAGLDVAEVNTTDDNVEPVSDATQEPQSFTVSIDGTEQTVTLDELRNGYLRQADYTRKTQEVASDRQRLSRAQTIMEALEEDPAATVQALAQAYGIEALGGDVEDADPEQAWRQNVERQLAQSQERERQSAVSAELSALHTTFGEFDDHELLQFAINRRIPNLEAAYQAMSYGNVRSELDRINAERASAAEGSAVDAKRAAGFVAGGANQATGSTSSGGKAVNSVRDAYALALETAGA